MIYFVARQRFVCFLFASLTLAACGAPVNTPTSSQPTPTVARVFDRVTPLPSPTPIPEAPSPTRRPRPTAVPEVTPDAAQPETVTPPAPTVPARSQAGLIEAGVYTTDLQSNWSLENSRAARFGPAAEPLRYNNAQTLAVTPTDAFSQLFFTLRQQSTAEYPRSTVVGLSFFVSGGAQILPNDALAVTVIGSNTQPFWRAGDESVTVSGRVTQDTPLFPETRLYFLGLNRSVPANEWVEVVVWLDELQDEPEYQYVTGIYIKNDEKYVQPYYIANMRLLLSSN